MHIVQGDPLLSGVTEVYRQTLIEAGVTNADAATPPQQRPPGRTVFHVAIAPSGEPAGVLLSSIGTIDQLSLDALIDRDSGLSETICECPAIAVGVEHDTDGTMEMLYRSVYCHARRLGAGSLATAIDPTSLELFQEGYGVMFRALGPITTNLGFDSLPVGELLPVLEDNLRRIRPDFYDFLTEPFTPEERRRFGLLPSTR